MSSEKNDTMIISFGSEVKLILQKILETQSFTKFVKSVRAIDDWYSCPEILYVLFARIIGLTGNNVWKSEKPLSLTETSRE